MNPRIFPAAQELYYSVKDLCMTARQKEKHGDISPAVHDQWKIIYQKLTQMFSLGCADLELCGWLAEAALRVEGISGLTQVFHAISRLVETHGVSLHSLESAIEMPQYWITPISELSGEGREGVLIQPLRLCSVVPNQPYGINSLWHYQSNSHNRNENEAFRSLSQSVFNAGSTVMQGQRDATFACIAAYQAMIAQFTELLPDNPPASSNFLNVLHEYVHAINDLAGLRDTLEQNLSDMVPLDLPETSPVAISTHMTIINREQALQLLDDVARFFRKNEPQSPIAPALETLIRRGRLPFAALLEDLLADDATRRTILAAAGINSAIRESN